MREDAPHLIYCRNLLSNADGYLEGMEQLIRGSDTAPSPRSMLRTLKAAREKITVATAALDPNALWTPPEAPGFPHLDSDEVDVPNFIRRTLK